MSSEVVAQKYLGTLVNRDLVRDWIVDDIAANTKILAGQATILSGALGRIVTTAVADGSLVRVSEVDADNTGGALGDKKISTFKSGAICVMKAGGDITPGQDVQCTADGEIMLLASGNQEDRLGNFLGKIDTTIEVGTNPAAVADGDSAMVRLY